MNKKTSGKLGAVQFGLLADASLAIDGAKYKAVNARDKNVTKGKTKRRMAQIEDSVARYLGQLDSADRQALFGRTISWSERKPSLARTTKIDLLNDKIAKLKEEMDRGEIVMEGRGDEMVEEDVCCYIAV